VQSLCQLQKSLALADWMSTEGTKARLVGMTGRARPAKNNCGRFHPFIHQSSNGSLALSEFFSINSLNMFEQCLHLEYDLQKVCAFTKAAPILALAFLKRDATPDLVAQLDYRAAEDQGTDLKVTVDSYNTKLPLDINDVNISVDSQCPLAPSSRSFLVPNFSR
jgi:hypothetical protein